MTSKSAKKDVTKDVKVSRLVSGRFLTLTEKPANQVAFKIVRKDKDGSSTPRIVRQRPVRRMSPSLAMEFPADASDEAIAELMKEFGLDDYKVTKEDERILVTRSDVEAPPDSYFVVHLKDGVKALVSQGEVAASDDNPLPHIAVAAIEFDKDIFLDQKKVEEWLSRNSVDFSETEIDNTPEHAVIVSRRKVEPDTEVKRCSIDDGVDVVVVKAERQDVPPQVAVVVNEAMYGNWGWGQLDFAAALADVEFSEVARQATDVLNRVMYEILFYSPLPVAVRKELIDRALTQFAQFMASMLDALPAKVLVSYRSDKEKDMTTKTDEQKRKDADTEARKAEATKARQYLKEQGTETEEALAKRSDDEVITMAADAKKRAEEKAATDAADKPVTRSEVQTIVAETIATAVGPAVTAAMAQIFAPAKRSDEKDDEPDAKEVKGAIDLGKHVGDAIRSSVEPIATAMKDVTQSVSALAERIAKVEGSTTLRSDGGDGKQTDKSKNDPFVGMFRRSAAKAE